MILRPLLDAGHHLGSVLAVLLVALLALPVLALLTAATPADVAAGLAHPLFLPALRLSLQTSVISLGVCVVLGTPLAWWLATTSSRWARLVEVVVELPVVLPPAVLGVALLHTFGRHGVLGPMLAAVGASVPFTRTAVVLAQVIVAAPLFVQAAANAFRKVDPDMLLVARTLGASPAEAFVRIALPVARPGLVVGASLAWARALGEFGATLLFAGNLGGRTQTLPLAIFTALESDLQLAVVFSLVLASAGALLLAALRLPTLSRRRA